MFFVDTNILVHAVNSDSPDHRAARDAIESYANGSENWALSWGVLYEYLRITTHPRVFAKPLTMEQAWSFVADLFGSPLLMTISETEAHRAVLESCAKGSARLTGNLLHDFHIATLMREHGIKDIVTLDTDFRAFPWVRVKPIGV